MSALELLDGWPATPRAAAVLIDGEIVDDRGDVEAPLPWASVTKLATALASLVAVDRGLVRLDDPAGPAGATVRHLLAHASGLDFDGPTVKAAPGARRIYSNAGYEALAATVEAAVGAPFGQWLSDTVLGPLALTSTRLDGSPASGMIGPLADLVGLAAEWQRPSLVTTATAQTMTAVAFPGLGGVLPGFGWQAANDWGLGPELRGVKAPHWMGRTASTTAFGHFGAAGGFVWVDPEAGVACCCLTGMPFGPWAAAAWPELADAVLAEHRPRGASA